VPIPGYLGEREGSRATVTAFSVRGGLLLDDVVPPYAENVGVEGGMVNLAEGESVGDDRVTRSGAMWDVMTS
jgi:hypothetical protein